MENVRPAFARASTAPIYQRRSQHQHQQPQEPSSSSSLFPIDESSTASIRASSARATDTRRGTSGSEVTTMYLPQPPPAIAPAANSHQGLFTPPTTPSVPYSSSSSSSSSSPSTSSSATTPRVIPPSNSELPAQTYFPMAGYCQPSQPDAYTPGTSAWSAMAPSVSSATASSITPSPLLRQSPPSAEIKMEIESSRSGHTLVAPLGNKFSSDSITIAAKKNNVLQIMADRWDQERDSHFEWLVTLDRDADMGSVSANFTEGILRVTVRRRKAPESIVTSNGGNSYRAMAPNYA